MKVTSNKSSYYKMKKKKSLFKTITGFNSNKKVIAKKLKKCRIDDYKSVELLKNPVLFSSKYEQTSVFN